MSEETIVRNCSPTLAGMKTGNLFTHHFADQQEMGKSLRRWNKILVKKGLRVVPLRYQEGKALIYVYRPSKLSGDLKNEIACRLLQERGYSVEKPERCVIRLKQRLGESGEFPHEIGLFLGYPPEDVCGFIENKAECCKLAGCWKVYGDVANAQKLFAKYKKCTAVYCAQLAKGNSIERLAVAV